jgi:serine protease AprX
MKVFIKTQNEVHVPTVLKMHKASEAVVSEEDNQVVIADLPEESINELREAPQFEVYDDIEFQPAPPSGAEWWRRQIGQPLPMLAPVWHSKTQKDVMDHNRASSAWAKSRGDGVTIAVVDTGADGSMPEFIHRSPHSYAPSFATPWTDTVGHGTMCAAIACGNSSSGGRYDGVAPDANLLVARSTLFATDLYLIYQQLLKLKRNGEFSKGIVVSNSYGLYTCSPPSYPQGHPYVDLVKKCIEEGMVFIFAAGNNHAFGLCNNPEIDDHPNTIWAVNSIDDVITVGTIDWNESNDTAGGEHANSSRGPGQWSTRLDKPDVVAPTYGEVVWGGGYQRMEWWGTSGACPQVAGLAALLLARDSSLTPNQLRLIIRSSARTLAGKSANCVGDGIIDCHVALKQVP